MGPTAVAWLQRSAQQLPQAPSLAFVHIPVPEFLTAWHHGLAKGSKAEPVNCPSADTDLLSVLLDANVTAVFSGHDHDNNYDAMHPAGMRLAYGHKTGEHLPLDDSLLCTPVQYLEPLSYRNAAFDLILHVALLAGGTAVS